MRFGPVVGSGTLPLGAADALARGASEEVPLIIGVTRDEAAAFLPVDGDVRWGEVERRFGHRATSYRAHHLHCAPRSALIDLMTDDMFRIPAERAAAAKASRAAATVFMYEFAWETPVLGGSLGAAHGVDVAFPFDNTELHPASAGSETARRLAARVSDAWIAFARDGDPGHEGLPDWPPFAVNDGAALVLDDVCRVRRRRGSEVAHR
jgi:para-nitrobenzyl esterase